MKIPLVDLQTHHQQFADEIVEGFRTIVNKANFVLGEEVTAFEKNFAEFCGAKFAVGVSSGLDALHLAVRALNIGPGDEVLVPANTFIATALGVSMAGAKPIPVDADPATFLMDVKKVEKAINSKTKAIIPVHLFGRMMDMAPLMNIAKQKNIAVIEDAAQSHGAIFNNQGAGTVGAMGCFSFYPGKNLGALGDGGMVVTSDQALKERLERLRNYGSPKKYFHPEVGFNCRLDTMQAVALSIKLKHLKDFNSKRRDVARAYNDRLHGVGDLILPEIPSGSEHVFHLYVVRSSKRDQLLKHLNDNGVGAGIHYPTPVHLHGAYADLGFRKGSFPVSEKLADEILSLPVYPELNEKQLDWVVTQVKSFFK